MVLLLQGLECHPCQQAGRLCSSPQVTRVLRLPPLLCVACHANVTPLTTGEAAYRHRETGAASPDPRPASMRTCISCGDSATILSQPVPHYCIVGMHGSVPASSLQRLAGTIYNQHPSLSEDASKGKNKVSGYAVRVGDWKGVVPHCADTKVLPLIPDSPRLTGFFG